jgi:hypothetical protein
VLTGLTAPTQLATPARSKDVSSAVLLALFAVVLAAVALVATRQLPAARLPRIRRSPFGR